MNTIIVLFVKQEDYNKMYKYNSKEEFEEALRKNENIPKRDEIVLEAYISDNLIDLGNTFEITLTKLKLILDFE